MKTGWSSLRWGIAALAAVAAGAESEARLAKHTGGPDFSAESRLILVLVTVANRDGAAVLNLRRDHFKIFDNSVPCPIVSFSREESPVMLWIVLDLSRSMKSKIPQALAAIRAIANTTERLDQGFLITFADRPELRVDLTFDLDAMVNPLQLPEARGGTALVDAVYDALQKARSTHHGRRALVVVSDGGDNASRRREPELAALDTQIYSISIQEHAASKEERRGYYLLHDLSKATGGLHFLVRNRGDWPEAAKKIALAMKNIYVIGYTPPDNPASGKWRNIRVVLAESGKDRRVYAKTCYYAAE